MLKYMDLTLVHRWQLGRKRGRSGGKGGREEQDVILYCDFVSYSYFSKGVWVRRTDNPDAPFYSSARIDFELYT